MYREDDGLMPGQRELEAALQSVVPTTARVDPVAAAFEAGKRSARRGLWWRSAAVLLLLATGIWLTPMRRGAVDTQPDLSGQTMATGTSPAPAGPLPDQSLLMLDAAVRAGGADRLPDTPLPSVRAFRADDVF